MCKYLTNNWPINGNQKYILSFPYFAGSAKCLALYLRMVSAAPQVWEDLPGIVYSPLVQSSGANGVSGTRNTDQRAVH